MRLVVPIVSAPLAVDIGIDPGSTPGLRARHDGWRGGAQGPPAASQQQLQEERWRGGNQRSQPGDTETDFREPR